MKDDERWDTAMCTYREAEEIYSNGRMVGNCGVHGGACKEDKCPIITGLEVLSKRGDLEVVEGDVCGEGRS